MAEARQATVESGSGARYPVRYGNPWTDPAGTGLRQQGNGGRQNGYPRRNRPFLPYLYQYYGGYYPVYVDVPVYGDDVYGGPVVTPGYDAGAAVTPDSGSVSGVIPPSTITIPADNGNAAQPDADAANAGQNASASPSPTPNPAIGPDSLVEAVQTELTRRGYYQGKIDSMFKPDTEAALRRFQQDNYLAPTGHINEPTLHALNLD